MTNRTARQTSRRKLMSRLLLILPLVCMLFASGCSEAREEPGPAAPVQAKGTPEEKEPAEPKEAQEEKKDVEEKKVEVKKPSEVEVGVLETKFGKMVIEFYPNLAPKTVKRIKELIGKGFYDGLIFHRVAPGFCIQGGDPTGTGRGGTGVNIPGEFSKEPFVEGSVGMARSNDPDSNDCQFFITLSRKSHLDGEYTLFCKVIEGMDVAHKIEKVPLKGGSVPKDDVHILSFRLEKRKLEK
jgi:peptidylprolyl isomerase